MRSTINAAIRKVESVTGKRPEFLRMNSGTRDMFQAELGRLKLNGCPEGMKLCNYSGLAIVIDEIMLDGQIVVTHQREMITDML